MEAVTSVDMRALEINSSALGVPTVILMENAGRAVKEEICGRVDVRGKNVVIFVGVGGKGGDGLVAARHLASEGSRVEVILLGENKHPDALRNLKAVEEMDYSVRLRRVRDQGDLRPVEAEVLVDAMLGTGLKGKPREPFESAIRSFNESKGFKVSIDMPSGIDPDTGEAPGSYVSPDLVVTLHREKVGLRRWNFNVVVKPIGIPPEAEVYVGPGDLVAYVEPRPMKTKKGDRGRVLVIGGSETYSGAPALASLAALRAGTDLVYVASPEEAARTIASFSPDLIVVKLKGESLSPSNLEQLRPWIERADVVALGPGLGLRDETVEAVAEIISTLKELKKRAVIDADALKAIKGSRLYDRVVITPHAGEFKTFFGVEVSQNPQERIGQVVEQAGKCDCTVLLKGYFDVVSDGKRFKLNKSGNPGMAVGGTGDVLTGIVASLMVRLEPFKAAYIGALVNGLAGTLAYEKYGERLVATDLVERIPEAMMNPVEIFSKKVYTRVMNGE